MRTCTARAARARRERISAAARGDEGKPLAVCVCVGKRSIGWRGRSMSAVVAMTSLISERSERGRECGRGHDEPYQ
jgi:hypothetical protein